VTCATRTAGLVLAAGKFVGWNAPPTSLRVQQGLMTLP